MRFLERGHQDLSYWPSLVERPRGWNSRSLAEINQRYLLWLDQIEAGKTTREIASRAKVDPRSVRRGAQRARDWYEHRKLPRFRFIWPVGMLTPFSPCRHGEIVRGARVYCVVCHKTGCDHWKALDPNQGSKPSTEGIEDKKLSPAEIAADVQSKGTPVFQARLKTKKTSHGPSGISGG